MVEHGEKLCGLTNFSVSWHVYPLNVWRTTFKADLSLNANITIVALGCEKVAKESFVLLLIWGLAFSYFGANVK